MNCALQKKRSVKENKSHNLKNYYALSATKVWTRLWINQIYLYPVAYLKCTLRQNNFITAFYLSAYFHPLLFITLDLPSPPTTHLKKLIYTIKLSPLKLLKLCHWGHSPSLNVPLFVSSGVHIHKRLLMWTC